MNVPYWFVVKAVCNSAIIEWMAFDDILIGTEHNSNMNIYQHTFTVINQTNQKDKLWYNPNIWRKTVPIINQTT